MTTTVTFLGHGAFAIKTAGKSIVIDPFFTGNPSALITAADVSPDYIIVTHGHGDHLGDTVDIAKRTGATVIANYEITEWLQRQEKKKHKKKTKKGKNANKEPRPLNVHAQQIGGSHAYEFGTVKLTIAHHGSMLPDGSYGGNPCGVLLKLADGTIYHAADTGLFYDMKLIGEEGIDLAILPIGDNYTMGPEDALRAVKLIQPKRVIPDHYNTFPEIEQDAHAWAARVAAETSAKPVVLAVGESCAL